ncbi:MAG: hypothetical protein HN778_15065 [Prolixibacteraceae bacterium]|jgi:hypothetical protein|nr:hypothetical protein [Prolixibacteraceae bacterium]MBT6006395.1 hypothetical protein [Prolixibacteraceae bacterium]MBT6767326.1 hypothetical protein [Prolixibacteraceae bacterium]MBT7000680.1 hypothetical protein [Prolixibacteraceae bacterium]MBT7396150.1 hypothetical protein [Prolixibacteraceae bacterium]
MPFGLFSQLIVRLSDLVYEKFVWLTGVWLNDNNDCFALLENYIEREKGSQIIEITIWGSRENRINLLSRIRNELNYIEENLFKNLNIIEQIPCSCPECSLASEPYYHSRLDLENIIAKGKYYSQCKKSAEMVPIGILLNSIFDQEGIRNEVLKEYDKMNKIVIENHLSNFGNPQTNIDTRSESSSEATSKLKSKIVVSNKITMEIQNFLGETDMLKEDIERELRIKKIPEEEIEFAKSDVEVVEKTIQEIELAQKEKREPKPASKTRLGKFINDLGDENSTIHKTLKMLRKGKDYGIQLAEMYNKIAQNTGMPSVPPLVLEVIKKI